MFVLAYGLYQYKIYDKASRHGHGVGDQPLDYRGSRWTVVGDSECATRCCLQFILPSGGESVMTEADATGAPNHAARQTRMNI